MGTQLISFRLKDEEIALLMQQADPEENPSLTAQRLLRHILGTKGIPPDRLSTLLTQVSELREQVESIKGFVDETIDQRLEAIDKVVNKAVDQHLKGEYQEVQTRFENWEQRLDRYFQVQRQSIPLFNQQVTTLKQERKRPGKPLNQSELAKRLINPETGSPYTPGSISRQKLKQDFPQWSQARDPLGVGWEFELNDGLFYPVTYVDAKA
ncbi:MAG: hypothetical protein ABI417_04130 [Coleofasciculaceae cyanobacterium]